MVRRWGLRLRDSRYKKSLRVWGARLQKIRLRARVLGFKVAKDWDEGLGSGIRGLRLGFRVEGSGSPAPN